MLAENELYAVFTHDTVLTGDSMADLALFLSLASLLELECPIKGTVVLMALRPSGR